MTGMLRQRVGDRPDPGFIYVVQMTGHDIYKIGRSSHVPRRMSEIGVQLPFPYKLLFAHKVPYAYFTEADLHRDYSHSRTNGEWFQLPQTALHHIQARLLYMQAEWLVERVLRRLNEDDLYPDRIQRYGLLLQRVGARNERRLANDNYCGRRYLASVDTEGVLEAEYIG
jgi:Meiotically Up-regulated Gene 113 (MUG113) protein